MVWSDQRLAAADLDCEAMNIGPRAGTLFCLRCCWYHNVCFTGPRSSLPRVLRRVLRRPKAGACVANIVVHPCIFQKHCWESSVHRCKRAFQGISWHAQSITQILGLASVLLYTTLGLAGASISSLQVAGRAVSGHAWLRGSTCDGGQISHPWMGRLRQTCPCSGRHGAGVCRAGRAAKHC